MKYKIEMKVTLPDVEIGRRYADMLERLETKQNRFVDRQEGCGEIVIDLLYHSDLPEIEIKES
ncbi:MAG: hypothetical protein J6Y78_00260 [Paludibacteraceae bacterium]|nr:hypothetical protein [Paludibacteraceae bacterium]